MNYQRSDFPENFLFGAATSSYQIEGHSFGGAGTTHWDDFAATPDNVIRGEHGAIACDHYHRFEDDCDLLQQAGFDGYRFSTSWARVLPEGRGAINQEGLDFYDRLVDALLARNIKPCATLYHWEMPSALADLGGWRNRDITGYFADFTNIIMQRIGDRVFSVAPINEPWCVSWLSHFLGHHAPGIRDIRATARAMHHVLLGHGRAIEAMRALGMDNLGAVFNHEWSEPVDASPQAQASASLYDEYYNRFFIGGVFQKKYPAELLKTLEPYLPQNWQDDFNCIGAKIDWCGLNYYTRKIIAPNNQAWPSHNEVTGPLPKTAMDWEIYPEGLYQFIMRAHREYSHDLPIYITENGMASYDKITDGVVDDTPRIDYLNAHLQMVKRAIDEGAPVKGYFAWSLLDNYEWALGYDKRFGLIHVDFESLQRTPKQSYHALTEMLK